MFCVDGQLTLQLSPVQPMHTNLNLNRLSIVSSWRFMHVPSSLCIFPLSCISGYSPFTSFPTKTVAANPVSDLSSPLDLGNCFLTFSHSFHTADALHSSNPLCTGGRFTRDPFPNLLYKIHAC